MKRAFATVLAAAAVLTVPATAATARILPGPGPHHSLALAATAVTHLKNDPDNGNGTPSLWALDSMYRTVTVTRGAAAPLTDCGVTSGSCWSYSALLTDRGTFRTIPGAGTPNQACAGCGGEKIRRPSATGCLAGTYHITFFASSGSPRASLVPRAHDDRGVPASAPFTSSSWPKQFFAAGTSFGGTFSGPYKWTYATVVVKGFLRFDFQRWVDLSSPSNNDGNAPGDGNITG